MLAGDRADVGDEQLRWLFAILELDSQEARARKLVTDFYRQESRWEELVSAHLRFSEDSNEKDERLANLYKACELVEDVIVDHEQAVALWQQVQEEDPGNHRAIAGLERLYPLLDQYADLVFLYGELFDLVEQDEADQLRLKSAKVLFERLGTYRDGFEILAVSLERSEPHVETLEFVESWIGEAQFQALDDG